MLLDSMLRIGYTSSPLLVIEYGGRLAIMYTSSEDGNLTISPEWLNGDGGLARPPVSRFSSTQANIPTSSR